MKSTINYLVMFIPYFVMSQQISGIIKDSTTNQKLQLANIVFMKSFSGTNSNLNGVYALHLKGHLTDSIKISYTGYKPKYIKLNKFTEDKNYNLDINLSLQENKLQEVIIAVSKVNYKKKYIISPKKEGNVNSFYLIGNEVSYFVKNDRHEIGKIKSLKFYFRNNKKATFIAKFRVKIYSYDKINNMPDENLSKEDIIISPKNKTYQYEIDLKDKKIPFLKEGVCVGIELIDENNTSKKGDKIGPGLRLTYAEDKEQTWNNYRNRGWFMPHNFNNIKNKMANLMVGMTVLIKD
ncbi:MAG: carboxypeptidase-like regulatory domain-containing protein [Flavobacterium sp.]|nr:carboxypeptidase-like regulatory domain-containing protein [Flavobacterium sp.]